jgi:hypothetical protein
LYTATLQHRSENKNKKIISVEISLPGHERNIADPEEQVLPASKSDLETKKQRRPKSVYKRLPC